MVAYSFQKQFAEPIIAGTKQQTIRGARKRHACAGDELQLFTGLRTRQTRLIGTARCVALSQVHLVLVKEGRACIDGEWQSIDEFARQDGFADWAALVAFWTEHHPGLTVFDGTLIFWGSTFKPAPVRP